MFNPLNNPQVEDWFRRLDAAWRRMPADEQARQREEVQQHLGGLVAANSAQGQPFDTAWSAALAQFGDPTQIGRKLYGEWKQSRTGFGADVTAILFGFCLQVSLFSIDRAIANTWLVRFYNPGDRLYTHGAGLPIFALVVFMSLGYGLRIFAGVSIGRKYPMQAMKAMLYGDVLWQFCYCIPLVAIIRTDPQRYHSVTVFLMHTILWMPIWLVGQAIVAYLASVTKRGWYKPALNDFKLTLPARWQTSR